MKIIKSLFFSIIYVADDRFSFLDKLFSYIKILLAFAPIAYLLELGGYWFVDNKKFVTYFLLIVIIQAGFGIWKHKILNQFRWEQFFMKTGKMMVIVIFTYFLLSMVAAIASDNIIAEGFELSIQVMTLFFPASKGIKSIFIISNGEYPSKWLMEKVYNYEHDGDLSELFKKVTKKEPKDDL